MTPAAAASPDDIRFNGCNFAQGFDAAYDAISPRTLVTRDRCLFLFQLARHASAFPGDIVELGVYRGGSVALLKVACPWKTVIALDTFAGIPNAGSVDGHANGDFSDAGASTPQWLAAQGIQVIKGIFPQSAGPLVNQRFCFAHFDGDTYQSAIDFLHFFYGRLSPGGVMVFDDYEWQACAGVKRATDEFFADKPERPMITAPQQAILIKL